MPSQKLRIIQVNDVYLLDWFPQLATIIKEYRDDADETVVFLSGDFLGPSLLSSLDHGRGMVDVMNLTGITHVCFGNHECDIPVQDLPSRIQESEFVWVNSNMQEINEKLDVQTPDKVILNVKGREVVVLGFLTDDEGLYRSGAFGDAKIEPVVEKCEEMLKGISADLIVPMTHQRMPEDRDFCQKFGAQFPIVIGAHDHEFYDETINGSRILKVGMDALNVAIIDIEWENEQKETKPAVKVEILETKNFKADKEVQDRVDTHMQIVKELDHARLFQIEMNEGHVFSTKNNRLGPTNGSTVLVTAMRKGYRSQCAIFNAGGIRANKDYVDCHWFTWSDLKAEIPFPSEITTVMMPGQVLSDTIAYSRKESRKTPPASFGGFLHTCDMINFDNDKQVIESIRGVPFDPKKKYLVALPVSLLQGVDNIVPIVEWVGDGVNISGEAGRPAKIIIVELFAAMLWLQMGSFADIDTNGDGELSYDEIKAQASKVFGNAAADLVVKNVMALADKDGNNSIDKMEMLNIKFIAQDMLCHVPTQNENGVLLRLASEMLACPTESPEVMGIVNQLKETFSGNLTRSEAINALGKLHSHDILK